MLTIFGLGRIDLLGCCCCWSLLLQSLLLPIHHTIYQYCCDQVRHAAALQHSVHGWAVADLYRRSWGKWRLESALHC